METNTLDQALTLADHALLARLQTLAVGERAASADLVAHLAALDARPAVYAAAGYGSLFGYCTGALRLSEDAACNRIAAAQAVRRFPQILDLLASGALSLTSVRLLRKHLTDENHEGLLARASGMSRQHLEKLIAELAPRPDVASTVRKLPRPAAASAPPAPERPATTAPAVGGASLPAAPTPPAPAHRPIVQPLAPQRYRVQFTIGQDTQEKLRRLQALLRREIPDGDPAVIFDRALTLLIEKVEKAKLGATKRPRPRTSIRPGTDTPAGTRPSRHTPNAVKRATWQRDGGRCAFVSADGQRCGEAAYIEFHHVVAYAKRGPSTVDNISLRCRRHNQHEAELEFGPRERDRRAPC